MMPDWLPIVLVIVGALLLFLAPVIAKLITYGLGM